MSINSSPLQKSILNDPKLTRPEKRILKCLVGIWGRAQYRGLAEMIEEKYFLSDSIRAVEWLSESFQLQIGLATLAEQCSYSTESNTIARLVRQLMKKGYIVQYKPGDGEAGQRKNISRLSIFKVRLPTSYDLPVVTKAKKAQIIAISINHLSRETGLSKLDLQTQVAAAEKARAALKAASTKRLSDWKKVGVITQKLDALEAKRSAA